MIFILKKRWKNITHLKIIIIEGFDQAHPRPPLFTVISQHAFLKALSSIFSPSAKVRTRTCLNKAPNSSVCRLDYTLITFLSQCSLYPSRSGSFIALL